MTDDQLLTDFLAHRNGPAFEALVRRYGPMVLRICRDVLSDPEDAKDAFQATFVVLIRQADSIRDRASLGRWLYEIACRISRRERRRVARRRSQERQAQARDVAAFSDFDPADREMKPILHDEIRRLPTKYRNPIVLCYFEGLTVEAASRRLGCPVGTLKSRLGKGRELLRSRLTRRGLTASSLLLLMFSLTEEVSAEVPAPLLDATVMAGMSGIDRDVISARVVAMVLEEEAKRRWARMMASWSLLLVLLLILGASRIASGRRVQAAPTNPISSPFAAPGAYAPKTPDAMPKAEVTTHCQMR